MTETQEIIEFEDGQTFTVPATWPEGQGQYVAALDEDGMPLSQWRDFYAGMTMCCGATLAGSDADVVCRSCYDYAEASCTDMPQTLRT